MSNGSCQPISPPPAGEESKYPIRSRVYEMTQLDPEVYRGAIIPLVARLAATDTTGSQQFRAPATHKLAIKEIWGHLALFALASETLDLSAVMVGNFTNSPMLSERVLMKAMNARLTLKNNDRTQNIIDGGVGSLSLNAILPMCGGRVVKFDEPHIVPAGETLEMAVSLAQSTASILGGATEYGVILVGDYVRVKSS